MKLYSVFVLRCQPFHNAHKKIIHESLNQTDEIIIIVGSSRSSITVKNPWTFEERKSFILGSFSEEQSKKIHVFSVADLLYSSHTWITSIQNIVNNVVQSNDIVTLVGHYKDDSSYYLNWFPQWKLQTLPYFKNDDHDSIDGTKIRNLLFQNNSKWKDYVPENVSVFIDDFMKTEKFIKLQKEFQYLVNYKKSWEKAPYPRTFVTTDTVVIQSGHVLLIERKTEPGKGNFALPGGFLSQNETIKQSAIRELKEETKIDVASIVLEKSIKESHVFDHPLRSSRGRTITHAFLIELDHEKSLPKIKGSDDAKRAFWLSLNDLYSYEENFFEDHIHIIGYFLNGKLYNR
jgi:bifunctional NMN adenylyltransferase/nudix hydrolase